MMDIYAKSGVKIKFSHPTSGLDGHQETANKHLSVGNSYTVEKTIVGGWHTDVFIKEVPGVAFNSVMFD